MSGEDFDMVAAQSGLQTSNRKRAYKDAGAMFDPSADSLTEEQREAKLWERRVTLRIPKEPRGDNSDVFIGVNGQRFLIQRGQSVDVPYPVYEALKHATTAAMDPATGEWNEAPTYAFSVEAM